MKINLEEQDAKKTLTIELEPEFVDQSFDKVLRKVAKDIQIKGFRKGKAPITMVSKSINTDALGKDVLEELIPEAYQKALLEKNLQPITDPSFSEVPKPEKGKIFSFKVSFDTKPQIKLNKYTELEAEVEKKEITESEIQQNLLKLQKNAAKLVAMEETRGLEAGDYAIADFESYLEGAKKPQVNFKKGLIQIKDEPQYPGLLEQIVGVKTGEVREFSLDIPKGDEKKDEKQKITFKITIHEIKKEVLPEINDDFARQVGKFSSLEELKSDIRKNLENIQEMIVKHSLETKLLEKIIEQNDIPINDNLINYETRLLISDLHEQLHQQGLTIEDYLKSNKINFNQLSEKLKPQAEKMAKIELALEAIINQENIAATDEEITKQIEKIAQSTHHDVGEIKKIIEEEGTIVRLKNNILREKATEFIINKAKVKYVAPKT